MEIPMDMPGLKEYYAAQANAPHPEKDAYAEILRQRHERGSMQATEATAGGDKVIAMGPHEHGGMELIVRKADGVVVLLRPQQPQVRNTPKGPKMVKTQAPAELPLVRRTAPTELSIQINRYVLGEPPLPALLLFQDRFSTAARELNLA